MEIEKIEFDSKYYPKLLTKINNPPKQLYVLGNKELLNKPSIAIIGSRNCSNEGEKIARKFAYDLSNVGVCINSGLAKGIDKNAHIGAIKGKGKTIAVLGCGLNNIYPKENTKLFYDILDNGGAVISEYEPNETAESKKFIQRNRIVSGLSLGVFVVEAKHRSGTGITAEFARKQGKPIFCIPHSINEKEGVGTNRLLIKGAKCVVNAQNILDSIPLLNGLMVDENAENMIAREIPDNYKKIYECIKNEPCGVDVLSIKTKESITSINAILTIMELEGFVRRMPGNIFEIIN